MIKKTGLLSILLGCSLGFANPATQPLLRGDRRDFDVTAAALQLPTLRYHLYVDAVEREPGDAATLYLQAILRIPTDADKIVDAAIDAHRAGKSLTNDQELTGLLKRSDSVFDLLRVASLRDHSDWNVPFHELGVQTMLTHLNHLRQLANLERVRGIQQVDAGKIDDAVQAIREIYAMGHATAQGGPLVSGLVGLGICGVANSLVFDLIEHAGSPNLYWPLRNLPDPLVNMRDTMDGERQWLVAQFPVLKKGRIGTIVAGDWLDYTQELMEFRAATQSNFQKQNLMEARVALAIASLPGASKYYAQTRHLSVKQMVGVDGQLVLATYFIEQYQIAADEYSNVLSLPLWEAIERSQSMADRLKSAGLADNTFVTTMLPALDRVPIAFGRGERMIAALTTIEALFVHTPPIMGVSFRALKDIAKTPVPLNPMTGRPFDYHVDNGVVILEDDASTEPESVKAFPLIFTMRIRK